MIKSIASPTTATTVTNTFTVSDTSITDSNASNNTSSVTTIVQANSQLICNNYALSIPIAECQALSDLYDSTAGVSWTNKANWKISPNISSWYGITTNTANGLVAHYTFDASNATDDAGNNNNGTLVNAPTFGAGRIGNAINFDGTQKRVVVNNTNIPK